MRDTIPNISLDIESGILNYGNGTHWTSWYKPKSKIVNNFDSCGFPPPSEFVNYLKRDILYSTYNVQKDEKFMCGHFCLAFLYEIVYLRKRK